MSGVTDTDDASQPDRDLRTIVPIAVAFAVIVVILIAIAVGGTLAPASKNVTESDKIALGVREFVNARNGVDPKLRLASACPGFDESRSPIAAPAFGAAAGRPEIVKVESASVDGQRGKADVTIKTSGVEHTATWSLSRSGDRWLVCN